MTIGTLLTTGMAGASAQSGAPTTLATVDSSGRVIPIEAPAQPVEILQGQKGAASPCAPATDLASDAAKALIVRIATEEKFYPDFVLSVAKIESRYLSTALSEKGAYGLMQLMPETAQRFDVDLCDPVGNVRGGVRFLRALHERYRNPFFILAAYNAGEAAVQKKPRCSALSRDRAFRRRRHERLLHMARPRRGRDSRRRAGRVVRCRHHPTSLRRRFTSGSLGACEATRQDTMERRLRDACRLRRP
ncbi:lytic transglycosylase domain-containing protein [Ancylobacter dichloromethanicus]